MNGLKACMHCGQEPLVMSEHAGSEETLYVVSCVTPGCKGNNSDTYWNLQAAIKAWNERRA